MRAGETVAGRYHLVELLGTGGMGEVWRATDAVLHRTVAVKILLPMLYTEAEFGRRFRAEARAMAMVHHPGVVAIYDFGEIDGRIAYLVMEFVAGESLSRMLRRLGRLPAATTMHLLIQAAQALQAVHDQGIVHRDVKPGNLMVRADGTAALTDFGIATGHTDTSLTTHGQILGTLSYLAPEQIQGEPATARSDVYALGLVAYECLAGQPPFIAEEPVAAALQRLQRPAPALPADIPETIARVVDRALATDPADRWQSAAELAYAAGQSLEPVQVAGEARATTANTGTASVSSPDIPDTPESAAAASRPRNRRRRIATMAAAVMVLLAAGTVTLWANSRDRSHNGGPVGSRRSGPPISEVDTAPLNATPSGALASGGVPTSGGVPASGGVPQPGPTGGQGGRIAVSGPGNRTSTSGAAISPVTHTASGGAGPYSWSASGLPAGLSMNSSGTVSGTPTSAAKYSVTVTATDSSSPAQTGSVSYLWTVSPQLATGCSGTNGTDVTLRDGGSSVSFIDISGCPGKASETATIEVHIKCGNRDNFRVWLGSPDATSYTLYNGTESGANLHQTFTWDLSSELASGTWTLRVIDDAGTDGDIAVIDSWTLTLKP